ncbi:MAG: WD40 repeat domain-containing protein [Verrucomicrobiota bacterium]
MVKSLFTHKITGQIGRAHGDKRVNSLAVSRKEDYLFSAGTDHFVKMFSLRKRGFPELKKWGFGSDVIHLRFSINQKYLAVGKFVYNSQKSMPA